MGLFSGFMRSSANTFFMPASRASLDGHTIHEKQIVSSSFFWTAFGNDVSSPSGTSSPQHSTTFVAPWSLNTAAEYSTWALYFSRLAVGTAATNPSMYVIDCLPLLETRTR